MRDEEWYTTVPLNEHSSNHKYCDPNLCPAWLNGWRVLDYDGNPLPGIWLTEEAAIDDGLCGKYLLSGHEVVQVGEGTRYCAGFPAGRQNSES